MHNKKEVSRQIYRMLIPMILENVLTTSASLVTTAMVGRLTALEISAQGVGGRITNTYLSLFKGLAIGVTVVAALYFGEGRRDKCRRTVEQAFATAVPLGLMITGLVAVFPRWFIRLFTSDADIMSYAVGYLQILAVGLPFVAITCFVTAAFLISGQHQNSHDDCRNCQCCQYRIGLAFDLRQSGTALHGTDRSRYRTG